MVWRTAAPKGFLRASRGLPGLHEGFLVAGKGALTGEGFWGAGNSWDLILMLLMTGIGASTEEGFSGLENSTVSFSWLITLSPSLQHGGSS